VNTEFIQIGNEYIRMSSISRVATRAMAGLPGEHRYLHLLDGGTVLLSEEDAKRVFRALSMVEEEPATKKTRTRKDKVNA
jgi:hypothetical protein